MCGRATRWKTFLLLVAFVIALGGCAGSQARKHAAGAQGPPWINQPELGLAPDERGKVFAVVGLSADQLNPALTQKAAALDARTKIAETIQSRVDAMIKDWMASSTDFANPSQATSKQFTEAVSRSVTSVTMRDTRIRNRWIDSKGTLYLLMTAPKDASFYETLSDRVAEKLEAMGRELALRADPKAAAQHFKQFVLEQEKKKSASQISETPGKKAAPPAPAIPKTSGAPPAWLSSGSDPRYPQDKFLVGVGMRSMSAGDSFLDAQKAAEADAFAAIGKTIRVHVRQKFVDYIKSEMTRTAGGAQPKGRVDTITRVLTQTEVNIEVQAGKTVGRYFDAASRTHYCLVAADRAKWAANLAAAISRLRSAAQKQFDEGKRAADQGKLMLAMAQFFKALNSRVETVKAESILNVVAPPGWKPSAMPAAPKFTAADAAIMLNRLLADLRFEKIDGDEQRGSFGKPLPKKLKVRLLFVRQGRRFPAANATIRFTPRNIQPDKIALEPVEAVTDSNGVAECSVTRADYDGQSLHIIEAAPAFEKLFPDAKNLALPKVSFTYRLLTPATTRIAVRIAEFADGKPTGQRSYVESKVAQALKDAGFQVIDSSKLAAVAPNAAALKNATDSQVVNLFGQIADIAVVGEVHANFREKLDQIFGRPVNPPQIFYQGRRTIRVIDIASGERLVSIDDMGQAQKVGALSNRDAVRRTFLKIAPPTAKDVVEAIKKIFPKQ